MELQKYTRNLNAVQVERVLSLVGGGALVSFGLARRSAITLPLALIGGSLLYHGVRGNRVRLPEEWEGVKGMPTSTSVRHEHGICVEKSVIIHRSPEELYQFWHNLENLPRFMSHLHSVRMLDVVRSRWVAKAPGGTRVEWDAEIINDIPNELIGWRSLPNSDIPNAGSVHFNRMPDGRGTELKVELKYDPPGGPLGAAFARLFGTEPSQTVYDDLHRLRQLMETGEVVSTESQPHGSRNVMSKF